MKNEGLHLDTEPNINNGAHPYEQEPYASQLCIILTEKCNIRCRHCLYSCSPSRNEVLEINTIESFIRQAAASKLVGSIGFSGGESFLDMTRLERVISLCKECGLKSTVTTNGFWASSLRAALSVLDRLEGLTHLGLSTDMFHQEFIPVQRIINAVTACNERDIDCTILVTHLNDPLREVKTVREQLRVVEGSCEIQQWPVLKIGRALSEFDNDSFYTHGLSNAVCVSANTPTLNANGLLTACCGPSVHWPAGHRLNFANMRQQTLRPALEAADQDLVIQGLRVWGPAGLLKLAQSQAKKQGRPFSAPASNDMCSICEYLFTNVNRTGLVERALERGQTRRKLAFARMAQLGEVSMFLSLTGGNDSMHVRA